MIPTRRISCCPEATTSFFASMSTSATATGARRTGQGFCRACALNKTIPDLSIDGNRDRWTRVEAAKKRADLFAAGVRPDGRAEARCGRRDRTGLRLPRRPGRDRTRRRACSHRPRQRADHAQRRGGRLRRAREAARRDGRGLPHAARPFSPRARSLLLGPADPRRSGMAASASAKLFGDERPDYDEALRRHYAEGAPPDWQARHISAYAATHPWEDWAETFAHYLHITDTLEMVHALNFPLGKLETVQQTSCRAATPPPDRCRPRPRRHRRPNRSLPSGALAGAFGSVELDQSLHGPARPLSLRDFATSRRASSNSCMS